jgi:hypothetical protein
MKRPETKGEPDADRTHRPVRRPRKTLALDFQFTLEPNDKRTDKAPDLRVHDADGNER